jgi:hypothetical protein
MGKIVRKCDQISFRRMPSSGMLRRAALVRTDVSEIRIAFIIMEERVSELGTTLAVTSRFQLMLTLFLAR